MISRKPGPPVPPRPSAAVVAHARLSKSQSGVIVTGSGAAGRTLVYKSPSSGALVDKRALATENDASKVVIVAQQKTEDSENQKENLKPMQLEMYTKSPSVVRSKRITSDSTPQKVTQDDDLPVRDDDVVVVNGPMMLREENRNRIEIKSEHQQPVATEKTEIIINSDAIEVRNGNSAKRPEPEGDEAPTVREDPLPVEKKVAFHEMLIAELTAMRTEKIPMRKKRQSIDRSTDSSPNGTQRSRIRTSDWVEVGDNGKTVVLTSCHISLEDSGMEDEERPDDTSSGVGDSWDSMRDNEERINMSLPGLPPLPKSLSGFDLSAAQQRLYQNECLALKNTATTASTPNSNNASSAEDSAAASAQLQEISPLDSRKSTLDTQLDILRREMIDLRQLDLSLLSQLWALNKSIQEFRTMLQEEETLSPLSQSPSPSEGNSLTSEDEEAEDEDLAVDGQLPEPALEAPIPRMRVAPPPPPPPNRKPQSRPV
ncbi:uncharacterized protein LOC132261473 [Phlebotomus argentipes]|uniref:uncharacterized protein LOC132261473 n=1 Tax=Phlebotomus argentipes TaxID=94469 RepID=UPI002892A209|nr:uncharacterized protein LOC132261473 [Phlebotomus argentipes]